MWSVVGCDALQPRHPSRMRRRRAPPIRFLADQEKSGACGTGMTDVSLPIFQVEVQKRRIQMIDAKAVSNDGGVHNLRPTTG